MGRPAAWWDGPFTWKILVEFTDYYKTLGIDKSASEDAIQKAYRKLAREFHPDVNKAAGSEDRFKEIGEAYEVLKDPGKRSKYDRYGAAWKQMEQQGGGFPGSDFGGFQGGGSSKAIATAATTTKETTARTPPPGPPRHHQDH